MRFSPADHDAIELNIEDNGAKTSASAKNLKIESIDISEYDGDDDYSDLDVNTHLTDN